MTFLKRAAAALLATTALAAVSSPSLAQDFKGKSAGDILVRARALAVIPQENGDLIGGGPFGGSNIGSVDIENDYIPELDVSYFITDNIALELIAGTTRHKVSGSLITGNDIDVGKVSLLPPTLTAQYHFFTKERVSPYVGAGINYTWFYDETAARSTNADGFTTNTVDYKNRFGWALQAGVDVALTGNWSLNLDVKKIFLKTDVTANVSGVPVTSDVKIDPWLIGIGVGYRF
ncbi:OmpW family protein [Azospirillum sp. YIM DDC1]|uniref:OmpW family protein n=2 Tax=Azospirillum TaxID=191 RepID=A0A560CML8_AZOBR|nr:MULTISPECIES: OmpW family outer membrane protein [Azospirillum]KAA0685454.1 OmpW family protein [Azospirillum brasilense]MBK3775562.1 outer membrane beta-barrel protein [Azospirillum brasilense]MBK4717372.1 OmpW family protein [Azospirillum aestuarii]TWA86081.1 outer membrane protein [Azospirillum brasilense]